MTLIGFNAATSTSASISAHQTGDLLMVFVRSPGSSPPSRPATTATVPVWILAQSASQFNCALVTAWYIAERSGHTTGSWIGAAQVCTLVLRAGAGKQLSVPVSSTGSANNTQTIVYPSLIPTTGDSTSWSVRCGTRTVAVAEVGSSPAGFSGLSIQPAGSGALISTHYMQAVAGAIAVATINTPGTNAPYRAHTVEVTESIRQPLAMLI